MRKVLGVTIVICCHNSANRLPQTLSHLAAQQVKCEFPWEVLVIDNASTDETARVALDSWPSNMPITLRVVHESRLGLSYARVKGLQEARYQIASFIDDDNWVFPNWIELVSEIMSKHPEIGACGGSSEPVFETCPPNWFNIYKDCYASGPQAQEGGDITETRGFLWGAGLSVRVSAWQQLVQKNFKFSLIDRRGTTLGAGSDSELCYALRLIGWRLWYEPRLRICHFIPAERLTWTYLRRLSRGFGASSVGLASYIHALQKPETFSCRIKQVWYWQVFVTLLRLASKPVKLVHALACNKEGEPEILYVEGQIGKLSELIRQRRLFDESFSQAGNLVPVTTLD